MIKLLLENNSVTTLSLFSKYYFGNVNIFVNSPNLKFYKFHLCLTKQRACINTNLEFKGGTKAQFSNCNYITQL